MAKMTKEVKSKKSAAEISPNEVIENQEVVAVVEEVSDLTVAQQFEAQLNRLQATNLSVEARQLFTKQEVMAIVASIIK